MTMVGTSHMKKPRFFMYNPPLLYLKIILL